MASTYRRLNISILAAAMLLLASAPALASFDVPESAYGEGAVHDGDAHVESRLIVDADEVAPGDTIRMGVAFTLDTSWHIYWQNPGEAGVPTDIQWESDDLEFGPLQWAAPSLFSESDGDYTIYGYGDEVVLFSEATVADDAKGSVELAASVDYLACNEMCLPGHSRLTRSIPVAEQTRAADSAVLDAIDHSRSRVPRRAGDVGLDVRFHYSQHPMRPGDDFEMLVELVECAEATQDCRDFQVIYEELEHAFIADQSSLSDLEVTATAEHPQAASGVVLRLRGEMPASSLQSKAQISGVIELEQADGTVVPVHLRDAVATAGPDASIDELEFPSWSVDDANLAAASTDTEEDSDSENMSLAWVLLMAFGGGMILNLMPCVFPVLALKVSSFTRLAHENKRSIVSHGMAYTGGIVASMLALAGVVVALRVAGTEVGWGFQFQQPHFLAALAIILVLFALNLFGVFEVTLSSESLHEAAEEADGVRRSFWEGILAVVLATPCSAPFLGTAVGFALASSSLTIVAVFVALGLGLAAPMVVLTLVPGWAKLLPRPGDWMVHLKSFLGFALLGSAIWIVWLLGRQTGVDAMAAMLVFSGVLGLAAWLYGLVQFKAWSPKKAAAVLAAVAAIGGTGAFIFPLDASSPGSTAQVDTADGIDWQPWSEQAVQAALDEGQPVFVDFTADWCLTCKVNEKNAIDTDPVREAIARHDVATFKADWTNPDERIRKKLAEYGKAGVPFYLVYSPERPDQANPLPEVITSKTLVEAIDDAAGDS
ncbi:MAG: thioredoxin family protein [Persicimonas sp.]